MTQRLGVGIIGSGLMAGFHIQAFRAVRDADILGIWSPTREHAEKAAAEVRRTRAGDARVFASILQMAQDPGIDALWVCGPNDKRIENMEEIAEARRRGAELIGVACEKPLGRNAAEARRMLDLAREAELLDGYLENQVFAPAVRRGRDLIWRRGASLAGRPYLARAAEEHSGPHSVWFWRGDRQGGGVLNDMMCHSLEAARFLLTEPGQPRSSLVPARVTARIHSLKWQRPEFARKLAEESSGELDYQCRPAEDYARATVEYQDCEGRPAIVEATTSWSYVGAGLRINMELLGPEYSLAIDTLQGGLSVFLSRELRQRQGEDLVEKQQAEAGLMPVVPSETFTYGYEEENRHMVRSFLDGTQPEESFQDGLEVTRLLMAAYMSAEQGRTLEFPPAGLDDFVPAVASGRWNPP